MLQETEGRGRGGRERRGWEERGGQEMERKGAPTLVCLPSLLVQGLGPWGWADPHLGHWTSQYPEAKAPLPRSPRHPAMTINTDIFSCQAPRLSKQTSFLKTAGSQGHWGITFAP